MGATTLYEFARRGVDALLLEQDPDFGGRDSSKTAGIMRTHYSNPAVVRMAIRGQQVFREIAGIASVAAGLPRDRLRVPRAARRARARPRQRRDAARAGRRRRGTARRPRWSDSRREPDTDGIAAIFHEPDSGLRRAGAGRAGVHRRGAGARRVGARRTCMSDGSSPSTAPSVGVETHDGRIGARQVVLAAGAWSQGLAARRRRRPADRVFGRAGTRARGAVAMSAPRASISNAVDAVYERPELGGRAGPGRSAVLVGTGFPKTLPDGRPRRLPLAGRPARPRRRAARPPRRSASRRSPRRRSSRRRSACTTSRPTGIRCLGACPSVDGLLLITGGSGHGFKLAPAFAELVAADACGERIDYADIGDVLAGAVRARRATFASAYGGNRA